VFQDNIYCNLKFWDGCYFVYRNEAKRRITEAHRRGATHLDLSGLLINELPSCVSKLPNITSLNLACNLLNHVPEVLSALPHLKELDVSGCPITQLPPWTDRLEWIGTRNTWLRQRPPSDGSLAPEQRLREELSRWCGTGGQRDAKIYAVEEVWRAFSRQSYNLHIGNLGLSSFPPGVGQLSFLTEIEADGNRFESIPEEIGKLTNLRFLSLKGSSLSRLPRSLIFLESLYSLQLGPPPNGRDPIADGLPDHLIARLAPRCERLKRAVLKQLEQRLEFWCAQGEADEDRSAAAQRLQELATNRIYGEALDLRGLRLRTFPPGLSLIAHLSSLHLTTDLELPDEMAHLPHLCSLKLTECSICLLPLWPSLSKLRCLEIIDTPLETPSSEKEELCTLRLERTALRLLPTWLGHLEGLRRLDLIENDIGSLPPSMRRLKSLTHLQLRGAPLRGLPEWLTELTGLKSLVLADLPKVGKLPATLGNLKQLTELYIEGVPIRRLPRSIGGLKELRWFRIMGTEIRYFPRQIGRIPSLGALAIVDTPVNRIPTWWTEQLGMLSILHIERTQICSLASLTHLRSLYRLSVFNSPLEQLPDLSALTELSKVELRNTSVTSVKWERLPLGIKKVKIDEEKFLLLD